MIKSSANKFFRAGVLIICIAFLALGVSIAQSKTGGGDITFEAKGSQGPVTYSHDIHVTKAKLKCADCHTKIFKMKKEDLKMAEADHGKNKACGVCHNGTKAFSQNDKANCVKCHKK